MMKIKIFVFNPVSENTYLLFDEASKEAVLIDCGAFYNEEKEALKAYIEEHELKIKYILSTHLHFDHCFGVNFATSEFNTGMGANKEDNYLLAAYNTSAARFGIRINDATPKVSYNIEEGMKFKFGNEELVALHVPGHTPGSIAYYSPTSHCVFVGDALFKGSIGRTDLPGGNFETLISAIKSELLTLPDNTTVYSGHGDKTTILEEKRHNMYLQ
ncbi:MAG: MBL fold metallo-hydrolase [Bacteroidales bacterium]